MHNKKFPQYLSSPIQVLWFEGEEIALFFICLTFALVYGHITWLSIIVIPYAYGRFKRKYPRGFVKHLLYFIGFLKMYNYPDYFIEEFVE